MFEKNIAERCHDKCILFNQVNLQWNMKSLIENTTQPTDRQPSIKFIQGVS